MVSFLCLYFNLALDLFNSSSSLWRHVVGVFCSGLEEQKSTVNCQMSILQSRISAYLGNPGLTLKFSVV